MSAVSPPQRGAYGLDAPAQVLWMGGPAVVLVVLALVVFPALGAGIPWYLLVLAAFLVIQLGLYLHSTRRGKFVVWERLLDDLELRGDERVLDLGCGRGAVLLAAARRLPEGRAVGVDLWRTVDQSGNAQAVTERNAEAEGVADRVELHTADMTELPFGAGEFDVVVSSLAIHNIGTAALRRTAVREALRVLRPGGRLVIVDIFKAEEYRRTLEESGAERVASRGVGWR
ncbi:class I SAM-dependent methyltransferase, partial [Nocardia sp. JMUB6875]|uniref:class I SAM-dependent methyltransferase n=1 Tax=Nocardia sp. JMUB6875 TaxID=3158170 RepID=UPI0034E8D316